MVMIDMCLLCGQFLTAEVAVTVLRGPHRRPVLRSHPVLVPGRGFLGPRTLRTDLVAVLNPVSTLTGADLISVPDLIFAAASKGLFAVSGIVGTRLRRSLLALLRRPVPRPRVILLTVPRVISTLILIDRVAVHST